MATGPGFPSGTDTFVPTFEQSGKLTIGYSRNINKFALPRYVQYVKTDKNVGLYLKLTAQEAARVVTTQDFIWPDSSTRPSGENGLESFNFKEFRTKRYDYAFPIGYLAMQQADFPIIEQHAQIKLAQMMTSRTIRMWDVLTTAANWTTAGGTDPDLSANHTDTATNIGGGRWDVGTTALPYIKKSLDAIAVLINLDTLGVVESSQLHVVVSPTTARKMAESAEIHDYIKGSYWAKEEILQGLQPGNKFGLPSSIYGYPITVEQTVRITSRKGVTPVKTTVVPDDVAFVLSRVGELEGVYGSPSFSTATIFMKEENTVEVFDDVKNRRHEGHVVEDTAEIMTSPLSGYYLTDVLT